MAAGVIEKPQTDYREYRPVNLENGIRAVVISDFKCDKAAAALSVKVGSIFDPKEVQGLAHFCEHMLFLGTEKYPREDEYNEFLAKHGGSSNAYTAECVTNYYFGVSPDHLEGALDRFSQFFVGPLFTESATDRELQAVDSEHSKNQQSDGWRFNQLLKSGANPLHPLCHFGTGSTETLKTAPEKDGFPVRERLLEFHSKYYSANLMCVTVLGKQSLDELEELVRSYFGPVVNKNAKVPEGPEVGGGEPVFTPESLQRLVRIMPVKDLRSCAFQFMLPQQSPMRWRTKPCRYLSFLLGHEGKGSVLSALKAQGLATELSAGPMMDDAGICIFEVGIQLTEKGEEQLQWVGELVFAYIRLMQQLPVSEELFQETQCIEEMNFRFRSVGNPVSVASNLSHSMQDGLPVERVFSGPAKVWDLDKDQVAEVAAFLCCERLRLAHATKHFDLETHCPQTCHWYGTRYGATPLPEEWRTAWTSRLAGSPDDAAASGAALGLALPLRNPFVAEVLDLKPKPDSSPDLRFPLRVSPPPTFAEALAAASPAAVSLGVGRVLQAYFRQDVLFDLPKANLNVEIYCPWCTESLRNRAIASAWCHAVSEELNELSYDADVAGLYYSLSASSRGLGLRFAGYQDKLPVLLRTISEKMVALSEVSEHTWNLVHTVMVRNAKNAAKKRQPYQQASEWEQRCMLRSAATTGELLEEIEKIQREHLTGVSKQMLDNCYCEVLLQGNFAADEVGGVLEAVLPAVRPSSSPAAVPTLAVAPLPHGPGSCVLVRRTGTNEEERNSAVVLTVQAAPEELANYTMCELVAQVLSQQCFDELRTKQQLGYIVALQSYADSSMDTGFCGIKVIVQSEKHPAEVHRRIDAWLKDALASLAEMTDEQLGEYHQALLTLKREKPKKLSDEFALNWSEVRSRTFRFTRREETVAFLERPPSELLAELRVFVREKVAPAPRMVVEVLGGEAATRAATAAQPPEDGAPACADDLLAEVKPYEGATVVLENLEDVEAFRKGLAWQESNKVIAE